MVNNREIRNTLYAKRYFLLRYTLYETLSAILYTLYAVRCTLFSSTQYAILNTRDEIALYNCRESSTNQLFLCKTNPILSAVGGLQMNVNSILTKDYRKKDDFAVPENKAKTKPICQRVKLMQSV